MGVEITVRGEAEGRYPAERAVVTLAASFEDAAKDAVYDKAVALQQAMTSQAGELTDRRAVTTWSSDQVAVSTHRPWLGDGRQGPPVHVARIGITMEFVDFERMSGFLDYWSVRDGVEITGIVWDLLAQNRRRKESDLRGAAVGDAAARAQVYADALRRGRVAATRIADPGLLNSSGGGPIPYAMKAGLATADVGGVRLTPEPVVIHVAVDACFSAE